MSYGFEIIGPLSKLTQSKERMGVFLSEVTSVVYHGRQNNSYLYRLHFATPASVTQSVLSFACAAMGHPTAFMGGYYEQSSNSVLVLADRGMSTDDLVKSVGVFLPIFALAKEGMNTNLSNGLAVFSSGGALTYDSNYETIVGTRQIRIGGNGSDTPQDRIDNGKIMRYNGQHWDMATNQLTYTNSYSGGRTMALHQQPYYEGRYTFSGTLRVNSMFRINDYSTGTTQITSKLVRVSNSGSGQYTDIVQPVMPLVLTTYPRI